MDFNFAVNDINADVMNTFSSSLSNSVANGTVDSSTAAASMLVGGLAGFFIIFMIFACIIGLVITILNIIAMWKIFTKAGQAGWKSLIPIYNTVILFKVAGISPLWVLSYLVAWVPFLGPLFILGVTIYAMINLSRAFGKEDAFAVGLVLLNTVFIMILAFGKSEYQLNKTKEAEVVEEVK